MASSIAWDSPLWFYIADYWHKRLYRFGGQFDFNFSYQCTDDV
jgi:hypothetical protein